MDLVPSSAVAEAAGPAGVLDRCAPRGVARPQELFTLGRGG
jgi:hypothetical protein